MKTLTIEDTLGQILVKYPSLARVLEEEGVDYCCGGGKSLKRACEDLGKSSAELLDKLKAFVANENSVSVGNPAEMTLTELADHIERSHHVFLRTELPRLDAITAKVASVHGQNDPRLNAVRNHFVGLSEELMSHMIKEEEVLFPLIRELEQSGSNSSAHCGSIANPIRQMESEHKDAGSALSAICEFTDDYTPPRWACNTYRVMLDGFATLERDLHWHIHKENNILFPRAIKLENSLNHHIE